MEVWKDIPKYGRYQVNSNGVVKNDTGRILKPFYRGNGDYLSVRLYDALNGYKTFGLHQIVLMAFVGLPTKEMPHCRHLDGNKFNNHYLNLSYGTAKENKQDSILHGTVARLSGDKNPSHKLSKEQVKNIRESEKKPTELARYYSVTYVTIWKIKTKRSWR